MIQLLPKQTNKLALLNTIKHQQLVAAKQTYIQLPTSQSKKKPIMSRRIECPQELDGTRPLRNQDPPNDGSGERVGGLSSRRCKQAIASQTRPPFVRQRTSNIETSTARRRTEEKRRSLSVYVSTTLYSLPWPSRVKHPRLATDSLPRLTSVLLCCGGLAKPKQPKKSGGKR